MPVPKPTDANGPRRLLRDVVFDKMLEAIVDGTLEPGERLNDDDLVAWLGVSRTPVREAIAKLHSVGLVEVEANRYTKVIDINAEAYREAAQLLAGLHQLAEQWGIPALSDKDKKTLAKRVQDVVKRLEKRDLAAVKDLHDAHGELVRAAGNDLFTLTEEPLRTRVKFLTSRDANEVDFDDFVQRGQALHQALTT